MSTKPKIRVGTDSFADLLSASNVFVDKSLFIQEFLENSSKVVLLTRPRRWGKSLNMDMLRCFLSIEVDAQGVPLPKEQCSNHQLFAGGEVRLATGQSKQLSALKIAQDQELMATYQGQFPVISLGFKDVKGSSYQEIEEGIKKQVTNLYIKHRYLKQYIPPSDFSLFNGAKSAGAALSEPHESRYRKVKGWRVNGSFEVTFLCR